MPPLSILDLAFVPEGGSLRDEEGRIKKELLAHRASLSDGRHRLSVIFQHDSTHSRTLAQHAEKWGYRR